MKTVIGLVFVSLFTATALAATSVDPAMVEKKISTLLETRAPAQGRYKVVLEERDTALTSLGDAAVNWKIVQLNHRAAQQTVEAVLAFTNDLGNNERLAVRGTAQVVIDLPALNRDVASGEVISSSDLTTIEFPAGRTSTSMVSSPGSLTGQIARRSIRANAPLFVHDFAKPTLVKKGELITIKFEMPGIMLSTQGKALSDAGKGDTLTVLNTSSQRLLEVRVIEPGLAVVTQIPQQFANSN